MLTLIFIIISSVILTGIIPILCNNHAQDELITKINNYINYKQDKKLNKHTKKQDKKIKQTYIKEQRKTLNDRLSKIKELYVETETNPETVIYRPIILSTSYEITRNFHNSLSKAETAKETNSSLKFYETKITELEKTWYKLYNKAEEIGIPGTNTVDKNKAEKLLKIILDETTQTGEKENARNMLEKIIIKSSFTRVDF